MMQTALSALCYFCENHGPRTVFTCQPIMKSETNLGDSTTLRSGCSEESLSLPTPNDENNDDLSEEESPTFHNLYGGEEVVDDELRCAACSSFDQGMGMISNDSTSNISFVSTQVPVNERLNQILKQATLRSLSVEVSAPLTAGSSTERTNPPLHSTSQQNGTDAERDGVVLFGDDENWYTLSYTFRLKDAKARGFHRSYSILLVCVDKLLLLRNYDFLVHGLCTIVTNLQEMTNSFFALEQEKNSDLRLASNVKGSSSHWLPHQFYPRQYTVDTSRSLKVITNHENVFAILHRQMLTLLKTLTSLDKDIVLEGCPTQDMLTAMEMGNSGSLEEKELITQLTAKQSLIQLGNLRIVAKKLAEIDTSLLSALVWHVVVGGQVVVQCNSLTARRHFLLSMVQLLPIGCVQLVSAAQQYLYSYKCNFLGCQLSLDIPEEVRPEIFHLILSRNSTNNCVSDEESFDNISLSNFQIKVEYFPTREESEKPAIVNRFTQLLLDPLINDFTLETALRATRNDWLNNAKLIFQLKHQREAIDLSQIMRIIKCKSQDSPVILFWQKGLSKMYKQTVLNTASTSAARRHNELASPDRA